MWTSSHESIADLHCHPLLIIMVRLTAATASVNLGVRSYSRDPHCTSPCSLMYQGVGLFLGSEIEY
jgi:hypothetical protein